jgi:hypothetical protein
MWVARDATDALLHVVEHNPRYEIRVSALMALLDFITGSWEIYQMYPYRMVLPDDARPRLEVLTSDPTLGDMVKAALQLFD